MTIQIRFLTQTESFKGKVVDDIFNSNSLEELILVSIKARYSLKMTALGFEGEQRNLVIDFIDGSKSAATIEIYGPGLLALYKYQPLPEDMPSYCDKPGVLVDEEWFDKRDARLRIKTDPWEGERLAAPTALSELILSYAFSSHGMVELHRDLIEIRSGVRYALRLKLIFLGADLEKEGGWVESVDVVQEKLEKLLEKRMAQQREDPVSNGKNSRLD